MPMKIPNPSTKPQIWFGLLNMLKQFKGMKFNHHAMAIAMGKANLFGGSGRTGEQAVAKSAEAKDATRNSARMMAKQYSEFLRLMGIMVPVGKLRDGIYVTTPLLDDLLEVMKRDSSNPKHLYRLLIRSVANPPPHGDKNAPNSSLRPMVTQLRAMCELKNLMHVKELNIGPMTIVNDQDAKEYAAMIQLIRKIRNTGDINKLTMEQTKHRKLLNKGKYSKTPYKLYSNDNYQNWTRLPQRAILDAGFATEVNNKELGYQSGKGSRRLIDNEMNEIKRILTMVDIRAHMTTKYPSKVLGAFLRVVHTNWLSESSGVPPRHLTKIRKKDLALITGYDKDLALKVRKREVLHHPYSEQSLKVLVDAMLMTDPSAWPDSPLMTEKVVELKEIPRLVIHQIKKKVEPVKILPKGESPAFKKWRDIQ